MYQRLKRLIPILFLPVFLLFGFLFARRYRPAKSFVCFVGYPRSGHTLVGSLLDAHPNVVLSIEANAFQLFSLGYYKNALLLYIEFWSKFVSRVLKNKWSGYSYKVEGGKQGSFETLQIIGDNDANQTSKRILENPSLTFNFSKTIGIPIKYIHVIRNPFDVITTMHNRKVGNFDREEMKTINNTLDRALLKKKIRAFFRKAEEINRLIQAKEIEVLNVHHENLIKNPAKELKMIAESLLLGVDDHYLDLCSSTIHSSSNQSRSTIEWPEDLKINVQSGCNEIGFLKGYTFAT